MKRTVQPFASKSWPRATNTAAAGTKSSQALGAAESSTAERAPALQKGFRVNTVDELSQIIETRLAATCLELPRASSLDAWANYCKLPCSELFFCSYGTPLRLKFPDDDYIRIQFHHAGSGVTRFARLAVPITAQAACISPAEATIDFGTDFQQIVWRVSRAALLRKMTALTGTPVTRKIEFDGVLPLGTPESLHLTRILACLLAAIAHASALSSRLLVAELEQALMVALLCGSRHTLRDRLDGDCAQAPPWQVRRAEEYIESNLEQPLRIERIATVTGTSARSLHRAFRLSRGYSPMEFVRQRRLERAHRMLEEVGSVTEVCFACGFGDISHFSREYAKAFGHSPSLSLGHRRRIK